MPVLLVGMSMGPLVGLASGARRTGGGLRPCNPCSSELDQVQNWSWNRPSSLQAVAAWKIQSITLNLIIQEIKHLRSDETSEIKFSRSNNTHTQRNSWKIKKLLSHPHALWLPFVCVTQKGTFWRMFFYTITINWTFQASKRKPKHHKSIKDLLRK